MEGLPADAASVFDVLERVCKSLLDVTSGAACSRIGSYWCFRYMPITVKLMQLQQLMV